ncbi:MAG TPA: hypothetical protein DCS66_19250 [Flavobacteriaceae bacterium]|nr:hypothetical protein [Flavobacteriaceae bacterium]
MATIMQSVLAINPDAKLSVANEDFDRITWKQGTTPIAKADIEAKQTELQAAQAYITPRKIAYPSWQDQLDMIYHDQVDGTTTFKDAIQAVKDANPKE